MAASTACETQPVANAFTKAPQASEFRRPERPSFDEVKEALVGQTLTVPNLRPLFGHWPQGINPALSSLQSAISGSTEKFGMKPEHRESLIDANVVDFAALCWPEVDLEALEFWTHLVMWTWIVEGYTDTLVADEAAANAFRSKAKSVWSSMLELGEPESRMETQAPPQQRQYQTLIASFKPFAARFCQMFDLESRQLLLDELFVYLKGTELEAKMRSSRQMPSYERYLNMRMLANGSGFFLVLSGLHKLAGNQAAVGKSPQWVDLKKTSATINFLVNDLLSANREFKTGEYLNSILLRAYDLHSVDASVAECVTRIKNLVEDYDRQAQSILAELKQEDDARIAAAGAIGAMRSFNVGSLEWSLNVKRYGLQDHTLPDGSIRLKLGQ
ncbi:hypothetical protein PG990_000458 [Apiospora arundinis]|uniref:Terpene synthase n=1 Tax=Apiospora arundinis TaxID=335852 RepID=A0ABR2HZH8_9PEZI